MAGQDTYSQKVSKEVVVRADLERLAQYEERPCYEDTDTKKELVLLDLPLDVLGDIFDIVCRFHWLKDGDSYALLRYRHERLEVASLNELNYP